MNESTMSWITEFKTLHNNIRSEYNISLLERNDTLIELAKIQCYSMYNQNRVFHDNVIENGGQNILYTTDIEYYMKPMKILTKWMNHEEHRNNVLNKVYRCIGSYYIKGEDNRTYFVSNYN